ncbi:class I SAM-dependent methyltransferase [Streptococcus cuniculipharyngis]|uniref:Class I SAM-dependent methyltransferase n=1 Tax=Streptococcus cuniculipharyngis TaxID=1562651 RepID=A0A5C5SF38_9STRE|nr:class I SAM-dependent methyltransferase [Streptococcus cuniculipharyngis]TWS98910.1 class I SAM-dependent methyltransferase [Streptococcus cuniculipharyngis]
MTNMYYTENPTSLRDVQCIKVNLLGQQFQFLTDSGVFSKKMVDYGSQVLLSSLHFAEGESLLDLGCGYGPLGISLAKVQGLNVTMVDVNLRALDLARQNASLNKVTATIFQSDIYQAVEGAFDHIISNPPIRAGKTVVHTILADSWNYLKFGGDLTIVIQKKQGAPSAKKKMEEIFGNCETLKKDKGYYIFRSVKK